MDFYRQCTLQKENLIQVSWIPEQFAKTTKILNLKNSRDEWDDGWRVVAVGTTRLPEDVVLKNERNFKEFSYHMLKFGNKKKEGL
jgi:hypothetical protein